MSRKYSAEDKALFQRVFFQFAWVPPPHLVEMMHLLADLGAVDEKWSTLHVATVHRWITDGEWRDKVSTLDAMCHNDQLPLPTDDEIDDKIMRCNLALLDVLHGMALTGKGDVRHVTRQYIDLQAHVRTHVQIRRSVLLTPTQLIELMVQAGYHAAGKAFDARKAKEFLVNGLSMARQLLPMGTGHAGSAPA